jgi:hypothetical protein
MRQARPVGRYLRHVAAAATLAREDSAGRAAHLTARSGLPGPRANLELAQTYAEVAEPNEARDFVAGDDEYLALCGALALAARAADPALAAVVRAAAIDGRWRVREGVALGLQRLAAADPATFLRVLDDWAADADPLVQRARVAALCEPPLLKAPALAAAALACCEQATAFLRALPVADRRRDDVRVLRQALGYCWSVAVAADPSVGLPAFARLEEDPDPDLRWIARSNRTKARLAKLLSPAEPVPAAIPCGRDRDEAVPTATPRAHPRRFQN